MKSPTPSVRFLSTRAVLCMTVAMSVLILAGSVQAANSFVATGSMSTARLRATGTLLASGKVLVAGGTTRFGASYTLASAEIYDPTVGTFAATGSMATPRMLATATRLQNGTVLIVGGITSNGSTTPSAEIYDPTTGTFSATGSLASERYTHSAVLLQNGSVLIVGGADTTGHAVSSSEIYDPSTGTFSTGGSMTQSRSSTFTAVLDDWSVLVAGGADSSSAILATAETFNAAGSVASSTTGTLPVAVFQGSATRLGNGDVLLVGGRNSSYSPVASAAIYDHLARTFRATTGSMSVAAYHVGSVLLDDGTVLTITGATSSGFVSRAEIYDPATDSFTAGASLAEGSTEATVVKLTDGRVLVAGGSGSTGALARAALYGPPTIVPPTPTDAVAVVSVGDTTPSTVAAESAPAAKTCITTLGGKVRLVNGVATTVGWVPACVSGLTQAATRRMVRHRGANTRLGQQVRIVRCSIAARRYRCVLGLPDGAWTLTTRAYQGSTLRAHRADGVRVSRLVTVSGVTG